MTNGLSLQVTLCAALLLGSAAPAQAVDVYLNGVEITGQKNIDFGKAKVRLDQAGNVVIDAPGYRVQELGATGPKSTTAPKARANLREQYFVVTEGTRPGVTGYDVQLIVNNKYIKTISDKIPQHVIELNDHLVRGANTISFRALRQGRSAQTANASDAFTLMIGVGKGEGGQLSIDEVLAEFKVKATDSGEKSQSFPLNAK